jgi:holo-[acyl-carrier protein] synthase
MNIVSQGIDLIECARVGEVVERHGERFLSRVLTEAERAYVAGKAHPLPHIAGRFAAKEAVLKVLGTGWRGSIAWTDVEVTNDANGQPRVALSGTCAEIARRRGIAKILVSITHTPHYAAATALAVGVDGGNVPNA